MDAVNDSDCPPPAKKLVANPGGGGGLGARALPFVRLINIYS